MLHGQGAEVWTGETPLIPLVSYLRLTSAGRLSSSLRPLHHRLQPRAVECARCREYGQAATSNPEIVPAASNDDRRSLRNQLKSIRRPCRDFGQLLDGQGARRPVTHARSLGMQKHGTEPVDGATVLARHGTHYVHYAPSNSHTSLESCIYRNKKTTGEEVERWPQASRCLSMDFTCIEHRRRPGYSRATHFDRYTDRPGTFARRWFLAGSTPRPRNVRKKTEIGDSRSTWTLASRQALVQLEVD